MIVMLSDSNYKTYGADLLDLLIDYCRRSKEEYDYVTRTIYQYSSGHSATLLALDNDKLVGFTALVKRDNRIVVIAAYLIPSAPKKLFIEGWEVVKDISKTLYCDTVEAEIPAGRRGIAYMRKLRTLGFGIEKFTISARV